ncbi:uncharacterized protein LOC111706696 [Eurytemora carolleeae]|uniref:uncharacterized protein LOC111706696 n=1 Tax=Eurytemora carolleeae TaxID=1294199 RepID=UPI000C778D45|nr:uncharacterized protein LOC111706696 [Eurytemora carolleeae]|eukprot:XP_023335382.1 uncharacterized protein LOC111706696 [Eurytemora affinis]
MNIILIFCVTSVIPNPLNGPNGTKVHAEQNTNGIDAEQNTNGTKVHAEQNTNGIKDEVSKKVKSEGSEGAKDKGSEVSKDKNLDKSENKNEDEIIDENTNKTKEEDSYQFTGKEETNSDSEAINEDLDENEKDKTPERIAEDKAKDSVDAENDSTAVIEDLIEEEIKDFTVNKYEDLDETRNENSNGNVDDANAKGNRNRETEARENCEGESLQKKYTNHQEKYTSQEENENKDKGSKEYEDRHRNNNQNQFHDEIKITSPVNDTNSYRESKNKRKVKTKKKKPEEGPGKTFDQTPSSRFEPDPIVFVIGFILALTSNFFMHIVRIYKWSVPQIQKNMIAIMNHYSVELVNLVITIQCGAIMFSSAVSYTPPTVALGINFLMDYITFTNIGFVITIAILRLLFVIKFDDMIELDPEETTSKIVVVSAIFYLFIASALLPGHISEGYISPFNAYITGRTATLSVSRYNIAHFFIVIICLITVVGSFLYIKYHLKTHHSQATVAAETNHSKSIISLKTTFKGAFIGTLTIVIVSTLQKVKQTIPLGVIASSILLTGIVAYIALGKKSTNYFLTQVKKYALQRNWSLPKLGRKNQIDPRAIELTAIQRSANGPTQK